jgi:integrase/recombinase XerD
MMIDDFLAHQHHLKPRSRLKYRDAIRAWQVAAGESFEDVYMNEEKVHVVLGLMEKKYAASVWNNYVNNYKRLAKWLSDPDDEVCPRLWRKIKLQKIDWVKKLKHKWLTEEEVWRILQAADHPRDKALIGVAIEGALRAGELLGLKIGDCEATSYGFKCVVSGKTGTSPFAVVLFAPALAGWLNHHPFKSDPNSPLWIRRKAGKAGGIHEGIQYHNANRTFKKLAERAGIKRRVSLHILRHTKMTWTARQHDVGITDQMANKMFRLAKKSPMWSRYTHLDGADSEEAFLALAGVKKVEREIRGASKLKSRVCLRCGHINLFDADYCSKCSMALNVEVAREELEKAEAIEKLGRELLGDPVRYKKFLEFLESL